MKSANTKDGFSFKLYQKYSDNSYSVSLVLRTNGQRLLINMPMSATKEQWNKERQRYIDKESIKSIVKKQNLSNADKTQLLENIHPEATINNQFLEKKSTEIREIIDDYIRRKIPYTNTMIKERLFVVIKSSTVEKYLKSTIDELNQNQRFGTARTFTDLYSCIKKFDTSFNKRLFPDIDYKYINDFYEDQKLNGRQLGGISVTIRALRTLLNKAINENVGSPETYPFSNQYGTRTGKNTFELTKKFKVVTRKRYIPMEYLKKFYEHEFTSIPYRRSKGLFFFSFFCGGINFADMANLKESDIKHGFDREGKPIRYFTYSRSKTKVLIEIQINQDIQMQIDYLQRPEFGKRVDGYLLPIVTTPNLSPSELSEHKVNKRKKLNKNLKAMAILMEFPEGLTDISTYFARHSFAMRLFSKTKSIDAVSAGLHHSNTEITKVYLESFGADEVAKISQGLLD